MHKFVLPFFYMFFMWYSGHPLSQTPTRPAKMFEIVNVRDCKKFKIFAFYKVLGKANTLFTSILTLVSLKANRTEKRDRHFYINWYSIFC